MKKNILIVSLLIIVFSIAKAQDSNKVRQIIKDLSAAEMRGRGYSYNGDSIAAEYLRNQFSLLKIEPLLEGYYQSYGFNAYAMEGKVLLTIDNQALSPFDDYRIMPYSKSVNQQVKIVHASPLILIDEKERESFLKKNKKKLNNSFIYLNISGFKFSDAEQEKSFQSTVRSYAFRENVFTEHGVLGLLIGSNTLPVWSFSGTDKESYSAIIYLRSGAIEGRIKEAEINFTNQFHYHETQNVCAIIEGINEPDSFIVIGAHYDHIGTMGEEVIFFGAHDNASGCGMVLDFAQYFKENPPHYSTVFILFSGEEAGLRGSFYFTDHPLVPLDRIKMMINLDLLGGGTDGITVVNSTEGKTKDFFSTMQQFNNERHYLKEVRERANSANSDHYPFSAKGVPAIFIYAMGGKTGDYHNYTDSNNNCSLTGYASIFKLLATGIKYGL